MSILQLALQGRQRSAQQAVVAQQRLRLGSRGICGAVPGGILRLGERGPAEQTDTEMSSCRYSASDAHNSCLLFRQGPH